MNIKKMMAQVAAAFLFASPVFAEPAATGAGEGAGAGGQEEQQMTPEELLETYKEQGYKYTSQRYGYSIVCPGKPRGVVPLSVFSGDNSAKGDVLVFRSSGYNSDGDIQIDRGWIIMENAFDEDVIPKDLNTRTESEQKTYLDNFGEFEYVRLTDVNGAVGVYGVTAKEIEVDTNGDGKPDEVMVADTQMIKTFFRGQFGGRFAVMLIDNPKLTEEGIAVYQLGILSFQEWPTRVEDGQNVPKPEPDKKDSREKKQKKAKKEKKKNK